MALSILQRRPKTPTGPRPTDDAVNAFVEFFEAPDLDSARQAFENSCAQVDLAPYGPINEFYRKYKIALKEHVPYKYRYEICFLRKRFEKINKLRFRTLNSVEIIEFFCHSDFT